MIVRVKYRAGGDRDVFTADGVIIELLGDAIRLVDVNEDAVEFSLSDFSTVVIESEAPEKETDDV